MVRAVSSLMGLFIALPLVEMSSRADPEWAALDGGSILCQGDYCMVRASRCCTRWLPFCNSVQVKELLLQAMDSALFLPLLRLRERLASLRVVDEAAIS